MSQDQDPVSMRAIVKPLIFCSAYAISVESHTQRLAARSLLDLANEEGSGSPNRIFPVLISIDFKQG